MPLTSASTLAEVRAAYDDNADWDTDMDLTKCKAFVQACRILLRRLPGSTTENGKSVTLSLYLIQEQLKDAVEYLRANSAETDEDMVTRANLEDLTYEG